MIFLSHNHADKPFVEPIAHALAAAHGKDKVFYDSWSIRPGDSIIAAMNDGLARATYVFVFFTKNALASNMVSLEWYNALMLSAKGKLRIVPVRSDEGSLPVLLSDRLYIDLYTHGIEAAVRQMVDLVRGETVPTNEPETFSNLEATLGDVVGGSISVVVRARYFMEPTAEVVVMLKNAAEDFYVEVPGEPQHATFDASTTLPDGSACVGKVIGLVRAITPKKPMEFIVRRAGAAQLQVFGVFHIEGKDVQTLIPTKVAPRQVALAPLVSFPASSLMNYNVNPGTYKPPSR